MIDREGIKEAIRLCDEKLRGENLVTPAAWGLPESLEPLLTRAVMDMSFILHVTQGQLEGSESVATQLSTEGGWERGFYVELEGQQLIGAHIGYTGGFLSEIIRVGEVAIRVAMLFGDDQYLLRTTTKTQHTVDRLTYLASIADEITLALMSRDMTFDLTEGD